MDRPKMEHVPTLCAFGTVGIAVTGLAFGRQEQTPFPRPPSNKRKAPGLGDSSRPGTRSSTAPAIRPTSMHRVTSKAAIKPSERRSTVGAPELQRQTVTGLGIDSPQSEPHSSQSSRPLSRELPSIINEETPRSDWKRPLTSRPSSSSWLRRISTISSLNDSPESSPRTQSPSISFSNGSTAPIVPYSTARVGSLPPNKLVKRSTSQRALSSDPTFPASATPHTPTLRRPATSHQRSATLRQQWTSAEDTDLHIPKNRYPVLQPEENYSTGTGHIWRPYFGSGYSSSSSMQPRKRHTSGFGRGGNSIRRIVKASTDLPMLVSALSITPRLSEDEIDDIGDRPSSTTKLDDADPMVSQTSTRALEEASLPEQDHDRKPRHSFSISDMFASSSPSWLSRGDSLRRKKSSTLITNGKTSASSPLRPPSRGSRRDRFTQSSGRLQRRRNITDPSLFQPPRGSPSTAFPETRRDGDDMMEGVVSSPLPHVARLSAFEIDLPRDIPSYPPTPYLETRLPSNTAAYFPSAPFSLPSMQTQPRPKRLSMATSDPSSTMVSSDNDTRVFTSGDEDEMDFQSDTAYDSLATRATASSNSGIRGPRIETIFDESPPPEAVKTKLVSLEDLISNGSFSEGVSQKSSKHSTMDFEDDFSTPVRGAMNDNDDYLTTPMKPANNQFQLSAFHSSPPSFSSGPDTVRNAQGSEHTGANKGNFSFEDDEEDWDNFAGLPTAQMSSTVSPELPLHNKRRPVPLQLEQSSSLKPGVTDSVIGREKRNSIFDWSEHQKSDTQSNQGSSPRPKTVHGKQGSDARTTRASGRRGPSALHLRSQSVPVSREPNTEADPNYPTAKFGTWGLGNKGVSEDWNDDFDFDEPDAAVGDGVDDGRNSAGSNQAMKVPPAILERQASVHGQFGHVQELTVLVEELKALRATAAALSVLDGSSAELWKEAESIVNLATLDDEENEFAPPRSPSSPTFNFDAFDEDSPPTFRSRKRSILGTDKDGHAKGGVPRNSITMQPDSSPMTPPTGRPRKESSAKAKLVLETIYQQRGGIEPVLSAQPYKKLPFDTQSLRDLVARAGVVTRALKDIVRKAEGVMESPGQSPSRRQDPPFSQIFTHPPSDDSPTFKKPGLPKSRSANSYLGSSMGGTDSDISGHMKLMTVV